VPSSQALPGFLITAPPSVCVSAVLVSLAVRIQNQKKRTPAHTTEPPGHKPMVVNVIVVCPFEEEEEGTGIASDVVKVQGEDPNSPGYLRGDRVKLGRQRSRVVGAFPLARSR